MKGYVARIMTAKGFGFIRSPENRKDYFFHRSDLIGDWDDMVVRHESGIKIYVEFTPNDLPKGPRAAGVHETEE